MSCVCRILNFKYLRMEDTNDYQELLICAICCTHMSNNVKLCILGHSVCCDCYRNLTTCPYCRSPWSRTRNRNLEQLIALFPKASQNKNKNLIDNENLKCPRCHSLMEGAIILCGDGHSICTRCAKDIYQCVLCPKLICYRRNFLLERFIDNVKTLNEGKSSSLAKVQALIIKVLELFIWFLGLFSLLKYTMYII